jgi:hypothetical protein
VSEYGEQLWYWLDGSLQQFKDDYRSNPEEDWEQRAAKLWERVGVAAGSDNPVVADLVALVHELLRRVDGEMTSAERADYLAGTDLDRAVVEVIELAVTRSGPQWTEDPTEAAPTDVAPAEVAVTPEQPARRPADVSEQVVRDLALPVLRELARTRPDLVSRHSTDELVALIGQSIARRLVGR